LQFSAGDFPSESNRVFAFFSFRLSFVFLFGLLFYKLFKRSQ